MNYFLKINIDDFLKLYKFQKDSRKNIFIKFDEKGNLYYSLTEKNLNEGLKLDNNFKDDHSLRKFIRSYKKTIGKN